MLLLLLILLVSMSAYFSATETAFSSINKLRIKNLANKGNNIVNILSASLATILFTIYFPKSEITISTIFMTIVVLIFGEISPKILAKECPET